MDIQEFSSIMVVGAFLSIVVQIIKDKFGTKGNTTKLLTIALSLLVGGAFVWVKDTPYFETVVIVLTTASTLYALFLNKK